MVAVTFIHAVAEKETARQAILKQLRESGATSPQMPGSVEVETDYAQAALADLLAKGEVREARSGAYYLNPDKVKETRPGNGFVALLAVLVVVSFTASAVALAVSAG